MYTNQLNETYQGTYSHAGRPVLIDKFTHTQETKQTHTKHELTHNLKNFNVKTDYEVNSLPMAFIHLYLIYDG